MGMSGTPEKRIEQHPRSEIHPWTAHPVHFFYNVVAGIRPTSPGFATVEIAPNPNEIKTIEALYPTVKGDIVVNLYFDDKKKVKGDVILPKGVTGVFNWQGEPVKLNSGKTNL